MVKETVKSKNDGYGLQSHLGKGVGVCGFDLTMRADQATAAVPDTTMWQVQRAII
jgi:hypothetical protein